METKSFFQQTQPTFILIHGAWHGAWCWHKVVLLLQAKGHKVIAVDLPSHGQDPTLPEMVTMADYIQKIISICEEEEQVILVGHSMGGIPISQAAELLGQKKVTSLIYVDAFLPRNGDSLFSVVGMLESHNAALLTKKPTLGQNIIPSEDKKTCTINPEMLEYLLYHDCSDEDIVFAKARLSKQPIAPLATPVQLTDAVFGAIPKYYILCTESQDLDKRRTPQYVSCEKVFMLKTSHSPFFSAPDKLVSLLVKIEK
jgi:pimeloyl-ACP methyl ester carboxylesterase